MGVTVVLLEGSGRSVDALTVRSLPQLRGSGPRAIDYDRRVAERRRLPVVQEPPRTERQEPPSEDARPPWHWVGFGTVAIFACWLLLATLAGMIVRRALVPYVGDATTPAEIAARVAAMTSADRTRVIAIQVLPHALALALGAFAGGFLVGRFGAGTGPREAAASGAATAIIATLLAWHEGGVSWASALTVVLAIAFAAWGGRAGASRRPAA
jgi:hypothetical protein